MKIYCRIFAIVIVCAVCCSSCSPAIAPISDTPDELLREMDAKKSAQFEALLERTAANIQGFRGLASAKASKGISRQEFTQTFVFHRPNLFRMDVFTQGLNQLVGLMVINDNNVKLLDTHEKTLHVGEAKPEFLGHITGIPVNTNALMLWLCGHIAPSSFTNITKKTYSFKGNSSYIIRYTLEDNQQIIAEVGLSKTTPKLPILLAAEIRDLKANKLLTSSKFLNHKLLTATAPGNSGIEGKPREIQPKEINPKEINLYLPQHVEVYQHDKNISVQLDFEKLAINPPNVSTPGLYTLQVPTGITVFAIE